MAFNVLKSKTVWGAVIAVIGYLLQPEVLAVLPDVAASIVSAIGALLAAIGMRQAVAKSGPEALE